MPMFEYRSFLITPARTKPSMMYLKVNTRPSGSGSVELNLVSVRVALSKLGGMHPEAITNVLTVSFQKSASFFRTIQ